MKRALFSYCLLSVGIAAAAAGEPVEYNSVRQDVDRLGVGFQDLGRHAFTAHWKNELETARRDANAYTFDNRDRLGDWMQWGLPFQTIHYWNLRYAIDQHDEAHAAVREALNALQFPSDEASLTQAVMAAAHIMDVYLQRWRASHAPEAIRLLDEAEKWALAPDTVDRTVDRLTMLVEVDGRQVEQRMENTGALHVWIGALHRHHAFFLQNEHLFAPRERQEIQHACERWLQSASATKNLSLDLRSKVVTSWKRALFNADRTDAAEYLSDSWERQYGGLIRDAGFYAMRMSIALFGHGDWDAATEIRVHVNRIAHRFNNPCERRVHQRLHQVYYEHLGLPGYELRRRRAEQIAAYHQRLEAADEYHRQMALQKEEQ